VSGDPCSPTFPDEDGLAGHGRRTESAADRGLPADGAVGSGEREELALRPCGDDRSVRDRHRCRDTARLREPPPFTPVGHIEREHDDISVTTATSALEAVAAVRAESFDCIVSDYQMPAISGLDFLTAIREEDTTIPFIVFTAKGSEEIASKAIATGVTDYVQKTAEADQYRTLADRIRRAVDAGRGD